MIKLSNVSKTYKSKNKQLCHAVDNISLNLPDNGMVFVVGKSGSGKSTLLNLIGGLDSISAGTINVNGNELSELSENDLSNYRNTHIGFIFQDYHLMDTLTICENVALSLKLQQKADEQIVEDVLGKVGLEGYGKRYSNELSGGERQRVAIARALVKNPHIILADEPTGNLDSKTSLQIMEILKNISKQCLVLIVSHNNEDAFNYADRIIKLESGKIISDQIRDVTYDDNVVLDNGTLYMPIRKFSAMELSTINGNIKNIQKIEQKDDKFVANSSADVAENTITIQTKSLKIKDLFKLCVSFLKNKIFNITVTAFMVASLFIILSIAQTLIAFNPSKVLSEEMDKQSMDSFVLRKTDAKVSNNLLYSITNEEIDKFYQTGYQGNVYKLYSHILCGPNYSFVSQKSSAMSIKDGKYAISSAGLLICDEQYLLNKYGVEGQLIYLAKTENWLPNGIIITDFMADSLLECGFTAGYEKNHQDLLGEYKEGNRWVYGYINGVVQTNYQQKHKQYFDFLQDNPDIQRSDLITNDLYVKFYDDVVNNLAITYSFNKNFVEDDIQSATRNFCWAHKLLIDGKVSPSHAYLSAASMWDLALNDGEIIINYLLYNELYGTNYKPTTLKTFVPHEVEISSYYYNDEAKENPIIKKTYKCVALGTMTSACVSDNELKLYKQNEFVNYALVFDDTHNIADVMSTANNLGFAQNSFLVEGVQTMNNAVEAFVPLFDLISIVLTFGAILILVSFSFKMIKDKFHEIGILKALGTKNVYISVIFGLQILLLAVATCLFMFAGYALLVDVSNEILFQSLIRITSLNVANLNFIAFNWSVLLKNYFIIFALSLVVIVVPFVIVKTIKPVKIIRAKE